MTDHEWIDWLIKKTGERDILWRPELNYYFGVSKNKDTNSSRNKYNEFFFIFKPRPNKLSNATLHVYEERNRLEELSPTERKQSDLLQWHERIYNKDNYYDGLGFLRNKQSNSKTYKLEKAILSQIEGNEEKQGCC
jgi:hypothetical protein